MPFCPDCRAKVSEDTRSYPKCGRRLATGQEVNGRTKTDYDKAIRLNPNYADAYCERGDFYHELTEYDKAVADKASSEQDKAEARAKAIKKSADAAAEKAKKDLAALQKAEADARKKVLAEAEDAQKLATELAGCVVADGHTVQCAMGELRPGKRLRGGAMTREAFETFKKSGAVVKMAKSKG